MGEAMQRMQNLQSCVKANADVGCITGKLRRLCGRAREPLLTKLLLKAAGGATHLQRGATHIYYEDNNYNEEQHT